MFYNGMQKESFDTNLGITGRVEPQFQFKESFSPINISGGTSPTHDIYGTIFLVVDWSYWQYFYKTYLGIYGRVEPQFQFKERFSSIHHFDINGRTSSTTMMLVRQIPRR